MLVPPGETLTLVGETEAVGPLVTRGVTAADSDTLPPKPPVLLTTMLLVPERLCKMVKVFGFAEAEKSGAALLKVPVCAFSDSTFPKLSSIRMQVELVPTLEGVQLGFEGYVRSVAPDPLIL